MATAQPAVHYPKEDAGPTILGATLTVTIVALITMVTRLYVRIKMISNIGWDDYVMVMAVVLCITGQIIIIPEVRLGAGRHVDQIPPKDFQEAFKLNFITQPIFLVAICLVKLSIGFFLLRVAVQPFYRRAVISIMVFMALYTIACFLTILLQCTNLAVQWDPDARGKCWGVNVLKGLSYTNVSLNITTDLLFAIIIPIPMLWHVQMTRRQKMSIIGILGLGVFATAAALVKVSYLPNLGKTGDWLWESRNITVWTVIESNIGIIAGNLPCLKPLFRRVLGSTYGRGSRKTTTPRYLSRTYGAGTNLRSVEAYNALTSNKTQDADFQGYPAGEAHMMTTIAVEKARSGSGSRSSLWGERPGTDSAESDAWLNDQSRGKPGGITKTTEVTTNVSRTAVTLDGFEDDMRPKEAHIV